MSDRNKLLASLPDSELPTKGDGNLLRAYYFSFDRVGVPEVDRILAAIARAGCNYHHTNCWNDGLECGQLSSVDKIQEYAKRCGQAMIEKDRELVEARAEVERLREAARTVEDSAVRDGWSEDFYDNGFGKVEVSIDALESLCTALFRSLRKPTSPEEDDERS